MIDFPLKTVIKDSLYKGRAEVVKKKPLLPIDKFITYV